MIWELGGDVVSGDGKKVGFDQVGEKALGTLDRLRTDKSLYVDPKPGSEQLYQVFLGGRMGMVATGPWQLPELNDAGLEYGVVPLPSYSGKPVTISFAASSALMKQIEQGAPADLFASADLDWKDYGAQKKVIKDDTRVNLLGNRLVLIAPKASKIGNVTIAPGFVAGSTVAPTNSAAPHRRPTRNHPRPLSRPNTPGTGGRSVSQVPWPRRRCRCTRPARRSCPGRSRSSPSPCAGRRRCSRRARSR